MNYSIESIECVKRVKYTLVSKPALSAGSYNNRNIPMERSSVGLVLFSK